MHFHALRTPHFMFFMVLTLAFYTEDPERVSIYLIILLFLELLPSVGSNA